MTEKIVNFNLKLNRETEIEAEVSSALALADNLSIKSSDSGLSEDTCWAIFGGPCPAALRKGLTRPDEDTAIPDEDVDETVPVMDAPETPQEQDDASSALFEEVELQQNTFFEDVDKQSLIQDLEISHSKELLQKSSSEASKSLIVEPSGQGGDSKNDSVLVEVQQVQQSVEKLEDITLIQASFDGDKVLKDSLLSTVSSQMVKQSADFKTVEDEAAAEELVKKPKTNINGFNKDLSNIEEKFKLSKTSIDVKLVEKNTTKDEIAVIEQPMRQTSKVEMVNVIDSQKQKSRESIRVENFEKIKPSLNEVIEEKHKSRDRLAIQSQKGNGNSKESQTPDISKHESKDRLQTLSQEVVLKIENLSSHDSLNALQSPLTSQGVLPSSSASQKSQKKSLDRYQQTMIPLVSNMSAFTSNISIVQQVRAPPVAMSSSADSTPVSKASVFTPRHTDIDSDGSDISCSCRHCIKSKLKKKASKFCKCGKSGIQQDHYTIKIFEESQEESVHRNYAKLTSLNDQQHVQKNKRVQTSRIVLCEPESLCFSPQVPYHTSPLYINDCKPARSKIQNSKKAASPRPPPMIYCNCSGKCNRKSKWAESSEESLELNGKAQRDSLMPSANLLNSLTNAFAKREKVREVVNKLEGRNQRCCYSAPNHNMPVKPVATARGQFGKEEGCRCCNSRKKNDGAELLKCQRNCYW